LHPITVGISRGAETKEDERDNLKDLNVEGGSSADVSACSPVEVERFCVYGIEPLVP
jgi:hypothetical protein